VNYSNLYFSVADPHHFGAEPDPTYHFGADPDTTYHFDAVPDPDLSLMRIRIRIRNTAFFQKCFTLVWFF
jgi:hypothetical protein